jgi:hypothetical protein
MFEIFGMLLMLVAPFALVAVIMLGVYAIGTVAQTATEPEVPSPACPLCAAQVQRGWRACPSCGQKLV